MEKEKKKDKKLIALIIVFGVIIFCIAGYFIYDYVRYKMFREYNSVVKLDENIFEVEDLNDIIENATFVNDKKEDLILTGYADVEDLKVKIENNVIIIDVIGKQLKIKTIKDPISVSAFTNARNQYNCDSGYIYVLNKQGKLYSIYYYTEENGAYDHPYAYVELLDIPKVISYTVNAENLYKDGADRYFVIAKTEDGKYYTDYDGFPAREPSNAREIIHIDSEEAKDRKYLNEQLKQLAKDFPRKNDSSVNVSTIKTEVECDYDYDDEEEYDEEEYSDNQTCIIETDIYEYKDYVIEVSDEDLITFNIKDKNNKVLLSIENVKSELYFDIDEYEYYDFYPKIANGKLHFIYYNSKKCYKDSESDKFPYLLYSYIDLNKNKLDITTKLSMKSFAEGEGVECK